MSETMENEKARVEVVDDQGLNIANRLSEVARLRPYHRALVFPEARDALGRVAYTQLTFRQLEELCHTYAHGLQQMGIGRGMRTLLMVRPSLDFTALTFALFKLGAVPVMIDPGMGIKSFVRCVRQVEPEAMIGIKLAHVLRWVRRGSFSSVRIPIMLGKKGSLWCARSTAEALRLGAGRGRFETAPTQADETAAILFTTGSTGPAKGVVYTHRIFDTQVRILQDVYKLGPGDTDLPCFPLFALFSTALGACAVIPEMDPTKPATVDPKKIIEAIENQAVTYSFGSPALWRQVSAYCIKHKVRFTTLKKVLMAGAPIPAYIHERLLDHILPADGQTHTPYGATEALPVADFTGREVLQETWEKTRQGAGICVGRPMPCLETAIIKTTDEPLDQWSDALRVAKPGTVGEIAVKGPVVTPQYFKRPDQTELAKIYEEDGTIWHRMGDLGYLDEQGRLWVCGRKSHRVTTDNGVMYTLCCEAIFNEHPDVYRSALIGLSASGGGGEGGLPRPAIVVEPEPGKFPKEAGAKERFIQELAALAEQSSMTREIKDFYFHPAFPVDIRHNAKIKREELAAWAGSCKRSIK